MSQLVDNETMSSDVRAKEPQMNPRDLMCLRWREIIEKSIPA